MTDQKPEPLSDEQIEWLDKVIGSLPDGPFRVGLSRHVRELQQRRAALPQGESMGLSGHLIVTGRPEPHAYGCACTACAASYYRPSTTEAEEQRRAAPEPHDPYADLVASGGLPEAQEAAAKSPHDGCSCPLCVPNKPYVPAPAQGQAALVREDVEKLVAETRRAILEATVFHGCLRDGGYYAASPDASVLADAAEAAVRAAIGAQPKAGQNVEAARYFTPDQARELLATIDANQSAPGVTPASEILAWLNTEQKRADRWVRFGSGVLRFALTSPELMRIRAALGAPAKREPIAREDVEAIVRQVGAAVREVPVLHGCLRDGGYYDTSPDAAVLADAAEAAVRAALARLSQEPKP